ncbi:MAG: hypothetical protein LBE48_00730 [Methanomassiliicoccaceae archaeon]|jgi:hypothetical protein|nr:hypothetical protein [Methanomassiliicoccaceae archaeon]
MFGIGEFFESIFGPYGWIGAALLVFFIFFVDAMSVPTLPELFFVIAFMMIIAPTVQLGLLLLGAAIVAEVVGVTLLYLIVERVRVPERIKKIADKYIKFLVCSDERMLLINRVAPLVPFAGAFISLVDSWKLSRALLYVVIGCIVKYGFILLMSGFFYTYFSSGDAQMYTIIFIVVVIIVSIAAAFLRKKKGGLANENC